MVKRHHAFDRRRGGPTVTIPLLVLRHGPTTWNEARRIQGRADIPLSPDGAAAVGRWLLPAGTREWDWTVSPLARARETAARLGLAAMPEPRLTEMDWGRWEGRTLADLRAAGILTAEAEAAGLDLQPPGGESPRAVQTRLRPWLAARTRPAGAVTHKGVLRALYALAIGWDMTGPPPDRLRDGCAHLFEISAGTVGVVALNIALHAESLRAVRDGKRAAVLDVWLDHH